jgi:CRP-like cAMP-binding protein
MLLRSEWLDRFIPTCARVRSARRRTLAAGQFVYSTFPDGRCWVVVAGYVKLLDPRADGTRFIRLILSRGGLFGDRPYEGRAFREFVSPQHEQAVAHGPAVVLELDRQEFEAASQAQAELATLLLESVTTRAQFLERRLLWQFTTPIRARVAATLRDLICFEGQRCRHGHTIDVRLGGARHQVRRFLWLFGRVWTEAPLLPLKAVCRIAARNCLNLPFLSE